MIVHVKQAIMTMIQNVWFVALIVMMTIVQIAKLETQQYVPFVKVDISFKIMSVLSVLIPVETVQEIVTVVPAVLLGSIECQKQIVLAKRDTMKLDLSVLNAMKIV